MKLLEEISTAKPVQLAQAPPAQLNPIAPPQDKKPSIEDLQSMIMDKLVQLESTHAPAKSSNTAPAPIAEKTNGQLAAGGKAA